MTSAKPYEISRRRVLEAYRHVRANRGAAGIDDESIEMFEAHLSGNLYKLWNRLASGSYFPPPVRRFIGTLENTAQMFIGLDLQTRGETRR